ncbi:respiratory nitrite reductase (cytochrome ammonia-forming) precursor [Austwickia chelonae]|uniref:nitrite reductase (cytochrome; ammonia-forming) n=1 Tax=Austwickia chelonae NBRC 105200 TaxID=1184607 RepID=K6VPY9_9MICO|nr:ammonia-forming cytochrome c nitrite reductase subunit c552 [Austwickia chelonae]GAB78814.1 cytochrome c-552 [Austwickia chelonae NBRC 105200]SEV84706.1 respiratory nitrite reductase (cytochrome ammonia-forming) precursor [Austwickia chelonae]
METSENPRRRKVLWLLVGAIAITAVVTMGLTALLVNILERKEEALAPFTKVVEIDDKTVDPAVWGRNFPIQYDMYKKTADQERTKFGGSEALPKDPKKPASGTVSQSKITEDPRLQKMWAGYAFATDFREERGHAHMLQDQMDTRRVTDFKQPGTCLNCHASTYVAQKYELGNGDLKAGFDKMNKMTYAEATSKVQHPVACIDCHDPKTMQLRITKPAFMEGIKKIKAQQGVKDFDVNKDATAQEMRSFVCGQCHVEYYFKGEEKKLTFPWDKGTKATDALAYYDEIGFKDWEHKITGAPALKAQHPEFETWQQGVHYRAGVSCADCHMPYTRVGSAKVSDHQVRSPMLNVNRACQGCHNASENEIKDRVEQIQLRFISSRDVAFNALTEFIDDIAAAQKNGAAEDRLVKARDFQRKAQFLIDYVEAENSAGFHAPGATLDTINRATDYIRQGQLALLGKEKSPEAPLPATPTAPVAPVPTTRNS